MLHSISLLLSRLLAHFQENLDGLVLHAQQLIDGPRTLQQLLNSIPDSTGHGKQERGDISTAGGCASVSSSDASSALRCRVLPLMLSPCYLVALLLDGGFYCQAAHIHWTSVMRRPQSMYTADAAASLLFDHFSCAALPFYLVAPTAPREMLGRAWGWGKWKALCEAALRK